MTQKAQLLAVIEQDLQADLGGYAQLSQQMADLYGCLMKRDCPKIDTANQQISLLLDAASLRARRRHKVLQALRLGAANESMGKLFALLAPGRSALLQGTWDALTHQVARCRELNERNGKLLGMHSDILQQLLDRRPDSVYQPGA